ncbi:sister chromatid cohesion and DNA repair protein [Aspergillus eucalypticola CBS 122712]|uniref:Sister chromatid cohesion and DNA repair protein n=1 Tax=Aspergillus eucalypticola (strain CBS 122712 / IBT 29274) TaxID=1448314 RepID=A0A317VBD4_ASPEC|nr:sister chromatid cohesion and DNA repair protein [Aspergillus eucalypticola CBS 122712]PWY70689.1 sister chromatid cohesion and DNA repair protein [Aspergillus eucalypticola CBS 122712]
MPARTRQGPSVASEAVDPEDTSAGLRRLKFNEPLSWRVGRSAIPIADLLQRLQTLAQELRRLEQEEIDTDSLKKVSQELASAHLLAHKDRGVRAWAACCIVDVLRLCAPDAPFTGNQLKDIFTCIVSSIVPALGDPSNSYNAQHIYVLNSLAEVKSIVLMTDLDHPDSLIIPLFTSCFDIVSGSSKTSTGEEVAKNVEFDMTRLLVTVIDETPVLAADVVDVIVAQFLRIDPRAMEAPNKRGKRGDAPVDAKQGTLLLKDYPPAYNMAKAICQACPERMTSHISQYFNNVIIDASAEGANGSSKGGHRKPNLDDSDEEGEDIKELSKAHRLIRELWRACPEVLQNVVPQLEAELSAESLSLRLLATQTIGDLTAGIGVAGPPPPPPMDPAAYPPVAIEEYAQTIPQPSVLLTPFSPKPFSQTHSSTYESFLSRRLDKSASVRAAWVTVVGRILLTSAGGSGLSESEEQSLIKHIASMLRDADEKVRVAAVDAISNFGLTQVVNKLGASGGFSTPDSVLFILAERVKDRKPQVREHATQTLARIWAVAVGEIEQANEPAVTLLKDGPSKIFDAFFTNDPDIHVLIDRVLFDILLPLNYPPAKSKLTRSSSSQSQKQKDSQASEGDGDIDVDKIRARRILTLLKSLDEKAKKVFFAMQARQISMRTAMTVYLQACEEYNGGVMEKDQERIKAQLSKVIDTLSKLLPDPSRTSADLWKFAKVHDRRGYQLIRFSMAAVSDYRTVVKAIKELGRRLQSSNNSSLLDTLTPLLYRSSSLVFNRSHIPAIMSLSRTDENGLANPAQEMLREISSRNPEVLEAQVQEMCKDLESQTPSSSTKDGAGTEEILKACSGFAKKLPSKLPKERKFLQSLVSYALHSPSPRAAKHAVSILMAVADKKEMYAKGLIQKCVSDWAYGSDRFLTKLATLSQLNLLAPREADDESDAIISIAVNKILLTNRSPQPDAGYAWSDVVDDETAAKEWALKIIVNRLRAKDGSDDEEDFRAHAGPVYDTLNKLVVNDGELSKKKDTPATQKSRLRLLAARSLLKLCASHGLCDQLLSPRDFNSIALVAQDPVLEVRSGFISQLKKKLVQKTHLSYRWYTVPFLLAFEPIASLKDSTLTWLRSRASFFSQQTNGKRSDQQTVMESLFSRLLSLLAYHPDYPPAEMEESTRVAELVDFSRYILFYLQAVANEHNLSLIFHIAQRVKQTRDGITKTDEMSTRLHTLSDLAQATIRRFADIYSQQRKFGGAAGGTNILQTYPGKMGVPSSIFAPMGSHREAQEVADKNFFPEEGEDLLDRIVRSVMRTKSGSHGSAKKRKPESAEAGGDASATKKARKDKEKKPARPRKSSGSAGATRTPKKKKKDDDGWSSDEGAAKKASTAARRRSSRGASRRVSYADRDSDEDDMEMDEWEEEQADEQEEAEGEEGGADSEEDNDSVDLPDKEAALDEILSDREDSPLSSPPPTSPQKPTEQAPAKPSGNGKRTSTLPNRRSSRRG